MPSVSLTAARQVVADRLAGGDLESALATIKALSQQYPSDYRTAILTGRLLLASGELPQAFLQFQRAAEAAPDNAEARAGMARCGGEEGLVVMGDLPPLRPISDDERPPISGVALGHLYLAQLLLTQCTAQLEPLWQAQRQRLDVGVALAEAHWRLRDSAAAEDVCRALLQASTMCLKANLILAQQLWAAGRHVDAQPYLAAAQAVDPENDVADSLYEWLLVRDETLVPLRRTAVEVELPPLDILQPSTVVVEPLLAPPLQPEPVTVRRRADRAPLPPLPLPVEDQLPAEAAAMAVTTPAREAGPAESVAPRAGAGDEDTSPVAPSGMIEPSPEAMIEHPPQQPGIEQTAAHRSEADVSEPDAQALPDTTGEIVAPAAEPEAEHAVVVEEPGLAQTAPEPALAPLEAEPVNHSEADVLASVESIDGMVEPALQQQVDVIQTAPEPALAPLEAESVNHGEVDVGASLERIDATVEPARAVAEQPALGQPADVIETAPEPAPRAALAIFEVNIRGQLSSARLLAEARAAYDGRAAHWNDACRRLGDRLSLGPPRASSVESVRGTVQLSHDDGVVSAMAIGPAGANLGLVRAKLRQQTSEEHNPH